MSIEQAKSRALVLGGGGVTGVAWMLGVLTSLKRAGLDVSEADLVVGTSAGSVVGAQITSGTSLEDLVAGQLVPASQSGERTAELDLNQFQQIMMKIIMEVGMDPPAIRARLGQQALAARTVPAEVRLAVIKGRLPVHNWPARKLLINAVDAGNGDWKVFDRESGVPLVEAVAASCAVPLVWPTVTVAGRPYMDGGMRSGTNADLASGYRKVLILAPIITPDDMPAIFGSDLKQEKVLLESQGSQVLVVNPDQDALAAIGLNVLDPARREPAARAGLDQGKLLVEIIRAFWSGQ